jgi:hypothetical protein
LARVLRRVGCGWQLVGAEIVGPFHDEQLQAEITALQAELATTDRPQVGAFYTVSKKRSSAVDVVLCAAFALFAHECRSDDPLSA